MADHTDSKLGDIANLLRINSIESTTVAGSGHPTSCASMAELTSVLFFDEMNVDVDCPDSPMNDRFVLSKGHAAPILYAAWTQIGYFSASQLATLRKIDSDLEGHPTVILPFVDVATGSLGQGLGVACGMSWTGKYLDKMPYRVYCVLGDGECAEGSVWEAMNFAAYYKLDNLVGIIDVNRLGQSEPTMFQHDIDGYVKKVEAFGCHAIAVNGHCIKSLKDAFAQARQTKGKPTMIIARTFKGKGLKGIEDNEGWHGRPLKRDEADGVIADLRSRLNDPTCSLKPKGSHEGVQTTIDTRPCTFGKDDQPAYTIGEKVATRVAYGTALAKIGHSNKRIIALDGDTKNSTFAIKFKDAHADRFIECFIAEQNLVSVAVGTSCRHRAIPFVSGFACFLSRAHDQIRMAAISKANVKFCGSHAGISIGEDGGSQMGLEDLAMFRCLPGATVFYPSDAVSTERAVELAAQINGICYIRTGRPNSSVIYKNDEAFAVGRAKVVAESENDVCTIVAAGVTLGEAFEAYEELKKRGKAVRVIDPFTIKPIDADLLVRSAKQTHGRIVVVEDHYPEGGIGEAVASALSNEPGISIVRMAVCGLPRSGTCKELLKMFKIDSTAIVSTIESMCSP